MEDAIDIVGKIWSAIQFVSVRIWGVIHLALQYTIDNPLTLLLTVPLTLLALILIFYGLKLVYLLVPVVYLLSLSALKLIYRLLRGVVLGILVAGYSAGYSVFDFIWNFKDKWHDFWLYHAINPDDWLDDDERR